MHYQRLKTFRKVQKFLVPIVPVFIALVFVFTQAQVPEFATNGIHTLAQPLWSLSGFLGETTTDFFSLFTSKSALIDENTRLRNELLKKTRETYTTRALTHENEQLRELLGRVDARPELLPATVLHGESFSPYDTFFIDIGSSEGVRDSMLVISPENIALGSVTKTLEHTAVVTQFSASGLMFDVVIGATSSVHTTVTGYGSGTMRITVPRDVQVLEGDSVTLPSFQAYTLGTVASIEVAPEDAYKTLYIRSASNAYTVRHVLIDTTSMWRIDNHSEITASESEDTKIEEVEEVTDEAL